MHCESKSHLDQVKLLKSQPKLSFTRYSEEAPKRTEAELQMAVLTAACNIPLVVHDQLSPIIQKAFPDYKIASKYRSASTSLQQSVRVKKVRVTGKICHVSPSVFFFW